MNCKNCGAEVENVVFCPLCGSKIEGDAKSINVKRKKVEQEEASGSWMLIGFFVPVPITLIVYFIIRKKHPAVAKNILTGMIVGFILGIIGAIGMNLG
jgi:uncharacterized membrane protein YvbJ